MTRLLLIEDDRELAKGLVETLAQSDYNASVAHTAGAALSACEQASFQLLVLDLGLPDMDGIELLRKLRHQGVVAPILILTARYDLNDRIRGLDAGGDDYLAKPFAVGELEARIRALLRRGAPAATLARFGDLSFDTTSRVAMVRERELALTARELSVLELLLRRPGRLVSKSQLLAAMYDSAEEPNPANIEVFISRLRRKLNDVDAGIHVRVFRGLGYRLEQIAHE